MAPATILIWTLAVISVQMISTVPSDIPFSKLYRPSSYQLNLSLPHVLFTSYSTTFSGKVKILFSFINDSDQIEVHSSCNFITLNKIIVNNAAINNYTCNNLTDVVSIPLEDIATAQTPYELVLEYTGRINPNGLTGLYRRSYAIEKYTSENIIITQLGSTHARMVFPCFDEPRLKAIFNVSIEFPTTLNVIFNTEEIGRVSDNATRLTTATFKPTPKMSTHVLAFIVSNFTCTTGTVNDTFSFRVCSRYDTEKLRRFALELTPQLLAVYNNFTDYDYSRAIGKLDIVAVPDSSFEPVLIVPRDNELLYNIMVTLPNVHHDNTDNWGLVIDRESQLLVEHWYGYTLDEKAIGLSISRELAHQWFGDLVTFTSWSEIFVSKGLCAYFQTRMVYEVMYDWEIGRQFIVDGLHETLVHDAFGNVHPLYYEDDIDSEFIESSYNEASYRKGCIIILMVQHTMGLDNFRAGIQHYIDKHKFGNVEINDLWMALSNSINESLSMMPANLSTVMENWIMHSGYPLLNVSLIEDQITISQSRFVYHPEHLVKYPQIKWYVPITYTTSEDDHKFEKTTPYIWLTPDDDNISFPYSPNSSWILLNNRQKGYYRVNYDKTLLRQISAALQKGFGGIFYDVARANLVDDFFNLARAGIMPYTEVIEYIRFLKKDVQYFPWKAATEGFRLILRRVGYDSHLGKAIAKDILDMMKESYLPWIFLEGSPDQVLNRIQQLVADWTCRLNNELCLDDIAKQFHVFKIKGRIFPNWVYAVFCNALRHSDDLSDWLVVYRAFQDEELEPTKRKMAFSALACSKNSENLRHLLYESIHRREKLFTLVEVMNIFMETENNPEAIKVAFQFLIEQQNYIIKNNQLSTLEYIFVGIAERLEEPEFEKLKQLVEGSHINRVFKEFTPKALEAFEINRKWAEELKKQLEPHYLFYYNVHYWALNVFRLIFVLVLIALGVYYRHRIIRLFSWFTRENIVTVMRTVNRRLIRRLNQRPPTEDIEMEEQ